MKSFLADLHIHTVLSPCGDLGMSPANIVEAAFARNLDIIGITDHNSTRHCRLVRRLAEKKGITVLCGAEVTTSEEVHCLAFMPDMDKLDLLQKYIDGHLPDIMNDKNRFGYQVQVDEDEAIVYEEKKLLIAAISRNIEEVEKFVHSHGGIFIPAHINRPAFGLISQLGFVPPELKFDALEISKHITPEKFLSNHPDLGQYTFIQSSDAHFPENIGDAGTVFNVSKPGFEEIRDALHHRHGRSATPKTS